VLGPRRTVMLAVDGPAPLAKLLTQRERRAKARDVAWHGAAMALCSMPLVAACEHGAWYMTILCRRKGGGGH
jgi:hypothetical protein